MRKQIMDSLRMAGQKVQNFDDAYAKKLADYIASFNPKEPSIGQTVQVVAGLGAGAPATRRFAVEEENDLLRALMGYGVPAVNAGVRYGVPAAGLIGVSSSIGNLYNAYNNSVSQYQDVVNDMAASGRMSPEEYQQML